MKDHLNRFIKFAAKELNISKLPEIKFVGHEEDKKRSFGHYRNDETINVRIVGRHPLDVMRTLVHELAHYKQRTNRKMPEQRKEDEANAIAGRIMRKYGDQNPQLFKEDASAASVLPANAVGDQGISATSTGPIQGFSPLLGSKKKKEEEKTTMLSRLAPSMSLADKAGEKGKSLRDIVGKNKAAKDMKKEKKFINPFGA